ncbi:hypothetical protein SB759_30310, partial [Pseudomonas sp. SIMBA_059]
MDEFAQAQLIKKRSKLCRPCGSRPAATSPKVIHTLVPVLCAQAAEFWLFFDQTFAGLDARGLETCA